MRWFLTYRSEGTNTYLILVFYRHAVPNGTNRCIHFVSFYWPLLPSRYFNALLVMNLAVLDYLRNMTLKNLSKAFIVFVLNLSLVNAALSQERKVAPTSQELTNEIASMDSIMFEAFNKQDMPTFKSLFTEDLEWFQDNGGLLTYKTVFENFEKMFKGENKLTRELIKSSLEVHPIKDYGAIEIGNHKFMHYENGKLEVGTFKFVMIWQKKNNQWKISKVISYDH